jgi:hypothetical protein
MRAAPKLAQWEAGWNVSIREIALELNDLRAND